MLNAGRLEEAKTIYRGLVAADPRDSVFHCHLGATHHRLGELDAAFNEYEHSLNYNGTNVDALTGRGEIYFTRGDYPAAIKDLRQAIELDPTAARPSSQRARALIWSLKEALEKDAASPNNPPE